MLRVLSVGVLHWLWVLILVVWVLRVERLCLLGPFYWIYTVLWGLNPHVDRNTDTLHQAAVLSSRFARVFTVVPYLLKLTQPRKWPRTPGPRRENVLFASAKEATAVSMWEFSKLVDPNTAPEIVGSLL